MFSRARRAPCAHDVPCAPAPRGPRLSRFLLLAAALLFADANALTLNRNAAHVEWRTVETDHFRFHYPRELEEVAGHIAGVAEAVAPVILDRYRLKLPNKAEFVVRDDIFSNGWANSLQNTMTIWATEWDFPMRGTHNWLRDVITHEFGHLASIQSGAKLPPFIQGVVLGYDGYYNAPVQPGFSTILPFIGQPAWFAEGVAQYESEQAGFDAWDSHRDMLLRVSVLEDKLLPIERMDVFAGTAIEYELGPYTQGFALVRHIAARYGEEALHRLWAENARIHRQTMSGSMQRVLGKSDREVHAEWRTELLDHYAAQAAAIGTQVTGHKLTSKGFFNHYPRWDSKGEGLFFVSNAGRDDFRAVLGHVKLEDTTKAEDERFTAIPGVRGYFDVAADDSTFLFSSAREADPNGVHTLDIYQRNLRRDPGFVQGLLERRDPTEKRYTRDFNAAHASYNRDRTRIAFVRGGASNFRLYVAPVPEGDSLAPDEPVVVWPPEDTLANRFGYNIYTPRFSPDGSRILFSFFDGTQRRIGLVGVDGRGFRVVAGGPHDARDPEWTPDGNSFYYATDLTGIFNIRRHNLATGEDVPVTNVLGGAFAPALSPDGSRLATVQYDRDGFSIYWMPLVAGDSAAPAAVVPGLPPAPRVEKKPAPHIETLDFGGRGHDYVPVPTRGILTPIIYGQQAMAATREKGVVPTTGVTKWLAGASGYLTDPLNKNEFNAALLVEVGRDLAYFGKHSAWISPDKESQFFLSYANHATPVSLGASFFRGNLASYDTVTQRDMPLPGGGTGNIIDRQDYAITFRNAEAFAQYELFDATAVGEYDKTNYLRLAAGYSWNDFNFYNLGGGQGFSFSYFKRAHVNTLLRLSSPGFSDKELVAPTGMAAVASHTYSRNNLFTCNSDYTSDCFVADPNGSISPVYTDYTLHDLDLGLTYGKEIPGLKNTVLVVSGFWSGVLGLPDRNRPRDSLETFFDKGLLLRGYPFLRDIENLAFSGENSLVLSVDLNHPLLPDLYHRAWTLFIEDLYLHAFWEAGRAWDGSMLATGLLSRDAWRADGRIDAWHQSVGGGLKLNARIYHNYPFLAYIEASRALSGLPDGAGNSDRIAPVRIAGTDMPFTQLRFGVTFGLYNGLLGGRGADGQSARQARHPNNPRARLGDAR